MTPQAAGAFLFALGAMMALNVMGIAAIFGMVIEGMDLHHLQQATTLTTPTTEAEL